MAQAGPAPDASDAVDLLPILYSNRSAAYASLKRYGEALVDASVSVRLRPNWSKAYSRLAVANVGLGRLHDAFSAFKKCIEIDPGNEIVKFTLVDALRLAVQHSSTAELFRKLRNDAVVAGHLEEEEEFVKRLRGIVKNPSLVKVYLPDQRMMQALGVLFLNVNVKSKPQETSSSVPESSGRPMASVQQVESRDLQVTPVLEKDKGNAAYKIKDFQTAVRHYSRALELVRMVSFSHNNTNMPSSSTCLRLQPIHSRLTTTQQQSSTISALHSQNACQVGRNFVVTSTRENEIHISAEGVMHDTIAQATSLFKEKGFNEVVFKGMGRAISRTVAIIEIIKRNIVDLHQNTAIGSKRMTDRSQKSRPVSVITITLSKTALDPLSPGYQSPLPTKNFNERVQGSYRERSHGRGKGHTMRGRGRSRGSGMEKKENLYKNVVVTCNVDKCNATNDDDDDCIVLESNPFEEEQINNDNLMNPKENSLVSEGTHFVRQPNSSKQCSDQDEISIIAERGQVACKDYPHSRHLCGHYPFDKTPHKTHCSQCYCYVCDIAAPCEDWNEHCDATELDPVWKFMRKDRKMDASLMKFWLDNEWW